MADYQVIDLPPTTPTPASTGAGYTIVDVKPNPVRDTPTSVPWWAVGLGGLLHVDPQDVAQFGPDQLRALARQGGLAARYVAEGLTGIADPINLAAGVKPAAQVTGEALTRLGLPEPETPTERTVGAASRGLVQAGAFGAVAPWLIAAGGPESATARVGAEMAANPAAQAVGAAGGGATAQTAAEYGLPPEAQLIFGMAGGMIAPQALQAAWSTAKAIPRTAGALARPFTEAGQRQVAGNFMAGQASDVPSAIANLEGAQQIVPGSEPTTGPVSGDPGLLALQRTIQNEPEYGPNFAARRATQNQARNVALNQVTGTDAELASAIADRSANADVDYAAARAEQPVISPKGVRAISKLSDAPAFMDAWKWAEAQAANQLMKPQNMTFENPAFADLVKKGLDAQTTFNPLDSGPEKAAKADIGALRDKYLDVLDNENPLYAIARGNFAAASGPINKMQTTQKVFGTTQSALSDQLGNPNLSEARFNQILGNPRTLGDLARSGVSQQDFSTLNAIQSDLARENMTTTVGRAIGSNTAQNLASQNVMNQAIGPGAQAGVMGRIFEPVLNKLYSITGNEGRITDILDRALRDPQFAAQLMRGAKNFQQQAGLAQALQARARALGLGATIGSLAQQSANVKQGLQARPIQ